MKTIRIMMLGIAVLFFHHVSIAQNRSQDEKNINQILSDMEKAWNTKNGQLWASHMAEQHDWTIWFGMFLPDMDRETNANTHQGLFDTQFQHTNLHMHMTRIRFLSDDIVIANYLANTYETGTKEKNWPEMVGSMVVQRTANGWEVISFGNQDIEYNEILKTNEPSAEAIEGFARNQFRQWYQ